MHLRHVIIGRHQDLSSIYIQSGREPCFHEQIGNVEMAGSVGCCLNPPPPSTQALSRRPPSSIPSAATVHVTW